MRYALLLLLIVWGCGNPSQPSLQPTPAIIAHLHWTAPTTNIDGTALTDLAGYRIYVGTDPSSLVMVVDAGKVLTYDLTLSRHGLYYFAVTAYNLARSESALSTTVGVNL